MRFAYADPPYLGQGASRYGHLHPDAVIWDDPGEHFKLVERLMTEYPDGWAASLNPTAAALPCYTRPGLHFAAWVRPGNVNLRNPSMRLIPTWELVVFRTSVPNNVRKGPRVYDHLSHPIPSSRRQGQHTGTKPPAFCKWVLSLLGYNPATDTIDDLFPGEGSMGRMAAHGQLWHADEETA